MKTVKKILSATLFVALATFASGAVASAAGPAPTGAYAVDGAHSFALFKIQHFGAGYVWGQFKDVDGKFNLNADPTKSTLELTLKTASIDTKNAKRDGHLQSPDFFNAAQFPTITFKSTKVVKSGDGFDVTGDLTIKGKTKSVVGKVVATGSGPDPQKKTRAGFEGHLTVNRNDFDLGFMPGALGDNVEITLALEGVLQ
jgi:polyisoprenoid-binding protein YceI